MSESTVLAVSIVSLAMALFSLIVSIVLPRIGQGKKDRTYISLTDHLPDGGQIVERFTKRQWERYKREHPDEF